jgi:hypothetical protein
MAGIIEEVRVDVERDRDAGVAEDAADLSDIEAEVDDQVAGKGVAQIVEAERRPLVVVEAGLIGRPLQHPPRHVALAQRGAARGREDPAARAWEACRLTVGCEMLGQLGDQRDLAHRGRCLRRNPPRRLAAVGAGELRSDPDQPGGEIYVGPHQPEQLGDPQAAEERGLDQQAAGPRAGAEQPLDLRPPQNPAARAPRRARALPGLEQLDRVGEDPAAPAGEAQHALQGRDGVGGRLRLAPGAAQLADQRGDVLDPDRGDPPPAESRQQVVVEVEAVGLVGARPAIAGRHHRLEALAP